MISSGITGSDFDRVVSDVVRGLARAERVNGVWFVNMPMLYPDGSYVTLRVRQAPGGFRVSDAGFAYREAERVGATRSFRRAANPLAEAADVTVGDRSIFVEATMEELERAILDVSETSRRVAEHICQRVWSTEDDELPLSLRDRLSAIFGQERLEESVPLKGRSTSEWNMSAVVHLPGRDVVFQAVRENGNSINKASTAFRDLSDLIAPPRLVAVVESLEALGARSSLLAPASILEESDPDERFHQAAEAA